MSNWQFDTTREPYCYVQPTFGYGYGHMKARFRLPVGPYMGDWIEVVLTGQVSRSSVDNEVTIYAVRFETESIQFRWVDALAKFKRQLDRKTGDRAEHLGRDGIDVWVGFLNAALDAWGIKNAHLFQRTDDHRAIPDTPYFGLLNRPTERSAFIAEVRSIYQSQVLAKVPPAREVA